jgi:hypothetical protein
LFTGESTEDHKKNEIMALIEACPGRHMILIGDSGEKDPEIFEWIRNKYPSRIDEILIRDVHKLPKSPRLKGMTIIPDFPDGLAFGWPPALLSAERPGGYVARKGFFYFHPSRPTSCGHLCRPNMLSRLSNSAHGTGRTSIHLGNPG